MYIYYLFDLYIYGVYILQIFYNIFYIPKFLDKLSIKDILVMIRNKLQVGFHYLLLSLHQPEISLNAIY